MPPLMHSASVCWDPRILGYLAYTTNCENCPSRLIVKRDPEGNQECIDELESIDEVIA